MPHNDVPVLRNAQVDLDGVRALNLDRALTGLDGILDRRRAGATVAHDQELRGVHVQNPRRCGQDDSAEPHETVTNSPDYGQQGHEQEALPQAWRGDWLTKQGMRVGSLALPHGAERVMQARSATETCSTEPGV